MDIAAAEYYRRLDVCLVDQILRHPSDDIRLLPEQERTIGQQTQIAGVHKGLQLERIYQPLAEIQRHLLPVKPHAAQLRRVVHHMSDDKVQLFLEQHPHHFLVAALVDVHLHLRIQLIERRDDARQQDTSPRMQTRYGGHGDYEIIALTPSSVQEAFDFTVRAFNLADKYRVPVFVLSDETVGHTREKLVIPESVEIFDNKYQGRCDAMYRPDENGIPARVRFFEGQHVLVDGQLHDERGIRAGTDPVVCSAAVHHFCDKILRNIDDITSVEEFFLEDAETVIISYGSVSRSALSAVRRARGEGRRVGMLKLNTVWPVPEKQIRAACENAKRVIVPEMNVGEYLREVQRIAGHDKVEGFSSIGGAFPAPKAIYEKIVEVK